MSQLKRPNERLPATPGRFAAYARATALFVGRHARARGCYGALLWALACSSGPKLEQPTQSTASAPSQPAGDVSNLPGTPGKQAGAAKGIPPSAAVPPEDPAPPPSAPPTDVEKALAYDPKDPLGDLEAADALDKLGQPAQNDATPPKGGCVLIDAGRRVWPAAGPAAIASVGRGFVIAGYAPRDGREQLFVVQLAADGRPKPVTAFDVQPPHPRARVAPPGLSVRDDNDVTVALIDGDGTLWARRLRMGPGGGGSAVEIARGADTRFAPALTHSEARELIAWTTGSTPMRTQLAVLSNTGAVASKRDITPESMGAAAPTFVVGASPPSLLMVDARQGMSPLVRVDLSSDGTPSPPKVVLPLSTVSIPPALVAASASVGTYVGYLGFGSAATSAVGLVAIEPIVGSPSPLVPGTGYGVLHVAAASAPRALLFAADAPTAPAKDAPREIHVHVVGKSGAGVATVIVGHGGATNAAIARDDTGTVAVAFTTGSGVYVARLRCDDQ
jgi:hypothetical protein